MDAIIQETRKDEVLGKLRTAIRKEGIPREASFTPYYKVRDELTILDAGLILKGDKIILPQKLQTKAIEKAHQGGNPGMSGLKRRIRMHFWFPGMDHHRCKITNMLRMSDVHKENNEISHNSTKDPGKSLGGSQH